MMREAVRRLHMRALVVLWLGALHGGRNCEAAPNPSSPLQGSSWGNPRRYVHLRASTEFNNFYLEISLTGHVRKTTHRGSYSVMLLKAESREQIAIFGVKSSRFLCMDAYGNLFTSAVCHRDDCLFHHKLLENHRDVYYSTRSGILLDLDGVKQVYTAGRNLAQTSLFLSEKSTVPLERLQHRERRDRQAEVPESQRARALAFLAEESDSRAARDDDADLDVERPEERKSSRGTYASPNDDDPWDVEHVRNPGSPRMSGTVG
ncbi:fibroblast growth factor 23 [Hemibagrus wyckioides]|uniref:fibroblast growth factor 23 n=1 Tax=Hemibagrus wyckioides TaxID=337641 RepID=UPI00266D0B92|nr:fibroblast growth factor 23 [Hemibagrus wyckioides]